MRIKGVQIDDAELLGLEGKEKERMLNRKYQRHWWNSMTFEERKAKRAEYKNNKEKKNEPRQEERAIEAGADPQV